MESGLGRSLLDVLAASSGPEIQGLDLATAFLQTQPTEADQRLGAAGVAELKEAMGLPQDALLRIHGTSMGQRPLHEAYRLDLHRTSSCSW